MLVTAYFSTSGVATIGLAPTMTIVDVDADSVVVSASAMTELANAPGWYKYDFTGMVDTSSYTFTANAGVDSVDDRYPTMAHSEENIVEGGKTLPEITRIMASVLAGKATITSGGATYKGIDGTTDRVVAEFDEVGNRTAITLDAS